MSNAVNTSSPFSTTSPCIDKICCSWSVFVELAILLKVLDTVPSMSDNTAAAPDMPVVPKISFKALSFCLWPRSAIFSISPPAAARFFTVSGSSCNFVLISLKISITFRILPPESATSTPNDFNAATPLGVALLNRKNAPRAAVPALSALIPALDIVPINADVSSIDAPKSLALGAA